MKRILIEVLRYKSVIALMFVVNGFCNGDIRTSLLVLNLHKRNVQRGSCHFHQLINFGNATLHVQLYIDLYDYKFG